MKNEFKVIWSHSAENDLLRIIEYIAQNNPEYAIKNLEKIKKQVSSLYFSPERCRIVPELNDHGITQYREMIISPWRIIYRISELKVFVLAVFDSRQNIEDVLLKKYAHTTV